MVRILKNLRGKLVDDNLIKKDIAPSYYLESLLYNVPSGEYRSTYQDSFDSALRWIQESADKSNLVCANEQYYLLRQSVNTCGILRIVKSLLRLRSNFGTSGNSRHAGGPNLGESLAF